MLPYFTVCPATRYLGLICVCCFCCGCRCLCYNLNATHLHTYLHIYVVADTDLLLRTCWKLVFPPTCNITSASSYVHIPPLAFCHATFVLHCSTSVNSRLHAARNCCKVGNAATLSFLLLALTRSFGCCKHSCFNSL